MQPGNLLASLRARRTYLIIYQGYLRWRPKSDFAELLEVLIQETQDAIASISGTMRRLEVDPKLAGINETLLAQGARRKGTASKLNFLLVGANNTLEWYQTLEASEEVEEVQVLWQALSLMERRHRQMIEELMDKIQIATSRVS
ncbi:MAG: hypothetical protein U9R25_19015 [Chloroflexota bacterium]|nr:hypothetical protein [Chloroflexota bacterium]